MSYTIGIDPGKDTGWAVFAGAKLVAAGVVSGTFEEVAEQVGYHVRCERFHRGVAVIEVPQVYPQRRWKGDPNDLIAVAFTAGAIARELLDLADVEQVKPHEWKGNAPKQIGVGQTLGRLTDDERRILDESGVVNSKKHNMIDAVGLGLWKLGRR